MVKLLLLATYTPTAAYTQIARKLLLSDVLFPKNIASTHSLILFHPVSQFHPWSPQEVNLDAHKCESLSIVKFKKASQVTKSKTLINWNKNHSQATKQVAKYPTTNQPPQPRALTATFSFPSNVSLIYKSSSLARCTYLSLVYINLFLAFHCCLSPLQKRTEILWLNNLKHKERPRLVAHSVFSSNFLSRLSHTNISRCCCQPRYRSRIKRRNDGCHKPTSPCSVFSYILGGKSDNSCEDLSPSFSLLRRYISWVTAISTFNF